jgi:hypothetical protein
VGDRFRPGLRVFYKRLEHRGTSSCTRGLFDAGIFEVVINSPDGIKAFTELTAGTGMTFVPMVLLHDPEEVYPIRK